MKIMHYFLGLPPLRSGGLMVYARDLVFNLSDREYNVSFLIPGEYSLFTKKSRIEYFEKNRGISIFSIKNPLPVIFGGFNNPLKFKEKRDKNNFYDFFKKNRIDVFHVHSLIGLPIELVKEAKRAGVKVVYTTHDYNGLCPKIFFFRSDNVNCLDRYSIDNCFACNKNLKNIDFYKTLIRRNLLFHKNICSLKNRVVLFKNFIKKLILKSISKQNKIGLGVNINKSKLELKGDNLAMTQQYKMWLNYEMEIINNFDYIIFNSNVTRDVYLRFLKLESSKYTTINITNNSIKDNRDSFDYFPLKNDKVIFLYIGVIDEIKGFFSLVEVLNQLKDRFSNWELRVYGSNVKLDLDRNYFKFYGKFDHSQLKTIMSEATVLIMPSKCNETFGFVGLEALSYGVPVVISDRVGLSDIVKDGYNGYVFKDSIDNVYLKSLLVKILKSPEKLNILHNNILNMDFDFSINFHTNKIIKIYENLLKLSKENI